MESLTKQQIVLVTLLVSFVTSIATGIVTVALMDQAPPGVTQTINRVVERTIEKVVPSPNQTAAVVTKETIVVKEDDLVVKAIEKNAKSLVSIIKVVGEGDTKNETFVGNGLVVEKDGLIVSDISLVFAVFDENQNPLAAALKAVFHDGASVALSVGSSDSKSGLAFFKPKLDDKTKDYVFVPATIAEHGLLKLGQTVIALGGEKISVATGIVSNLSPDGQATDSKENSKTGADTAGSAPTTVINKIITTNAPVPGKTLGGILVNLSGGVVGIRA